MRESARVLHIDVLISSAKCTFTNRYFGMGFMKSQCGMRITNPDENDRSPWKCYLGVMELGLKTTVGAILDASATPLNFADEIETEDVYGMSDTTVNLLCKNQLAADYCWFQHPNGRRISVSEHAMHMDTNEYR